MLFVWFIIAFFVGMLLSPWNSSGLLMTIAVSVGLQAIYSLIWGFAMRRFGIVIASILGWLIGKAFFVPFLERRGWKLWIDQRLIAVVPTPLHSYLKLDPAVRSPSTRR
jgi:hypothetical protein